MTYKNRLLKVIPGGAHTYSRGYDQFPSNAPEILKRGKDSYVYDENDNKFLDYGMGLRAVNLGYSNKQVDEAAIKQLGFGNNLTKPSLIELEAAELFVDNIDSADMVKFTKNGSSATTAAIKLSRAYTGRSMIARCIEQPFLSYDDWFIGSTPIKLGINQNDIDNIKTFNYNNIESLERVFCEYPNQIACVMLEPATTEHPKDNFLHKVKEICHKNGALFILDEMITGFRWHLKGAQYYYNIEPDLSTFGKAMANGYSVSAVSGKKEIMKLGSIELIGAERLFLLSSTHGAEMSTLAAFTATLKFIKSKGVIEHNWQYGDRLISLINEISQKHGLQNNFYAGGIACNPFYTTLDKNGKNCLGLRTLFSQEMIKNKVLMPWISISYCHDEKELNITKTALERTLEIYKKALKFGYDKYLIGDVIKPVFRKYN